MVKRISSEIEYSYFPLINKRIGGKKVDYFEDGSEKEEFYGLNRIVHEIICKIKH